MRDVSLVLRLTLGLNSHSLAICSQSAARSVDLPSPLTSSFSAALRWSRHGQVADTASSELR